MALARRGSGQRFSANIWPGFVDAMTALLLVLMFVLTIFMVVQSVLRETITTQDAELSSLSAQISGLADALALEQTKVGDLQSALDQSQQAREAQSQLVATSRQNNRSPCRRQNPPVALDANKKSHWKAPSSTTTTTSSPASWSCAKAKTPAWSSKA